MRSDYGFVLAGPDCCEKVFMVKSRACFYAFRIIRIVVEAFAVKALREFRDENNLLHSWVLRFLEYPAWIIFFMHGESPGWLWG